MKKGFLFFLLVWTLFTSVFSVSLNGYLNFDAKTFQQNVYLDMPYRVYFGTGCNLEINLNNLTTGVNINLYKDSPVDIFIIPGIYAGYSDRLWFTDWAFTVSSSYFMTDKIFPDHLYLDFKLKLIPIKFDFNLSYNFSLYTGIMTGINIPDNYRKFIYYFGINLEAGGKIL